ncbi:glutamate 5-kinase [Sulfurimonas sp. MAG313]|nr:glutamate 5-kinase [Sulfurimonas sp. MAG313]MDF1880517.1 glutamate 5-kinase [Sulfurimonas sp. MAG313]
MKRIVIKVGSAVLAEQNHIARDRMQALVDLIVDLRKKYDVILVTSGSVAAGYTELKLDKKILANKQALAAIGQPLLMHRYKKQFEPYNVITSQVLVTTSNFNTSEQVKIAENAVSTLLEHKVLPIINENDATSVDELLLGDNDQLSAYAAFYFNAELLVILSDIDAYYDHDPRINPNAKAYKIVPNIRKSELEGSVTPNSSFATGGIVTKLKAADFLLKRGQKMFLASGFNLDNARSFLLDNEHKGGTLFQ